MGVPSCWLCNSGSFGLVATGIIRITYSVFFFFFNQKTFVVVTEDEILLDQKRDVALLYFRLAVNAYLKAHPVVDSQNCQQIHLKMA
jgi:hypothetical protein